MPAKSMTAILQKIRKGRARLRATKKTCCAGLFCLLPAAVERTAPLPLPYSAAGGAAVTAALVTRVCSFVKKVISAHPFVLSWEKMYRSHLHNGRERAAILWT